MDHENEKQLVFFKDILFAVLYRWKALVLAAIIGALLLGGFQFYKNSRPVLPASQDSVEKIQRLEQQIAIKNNAIANQEYYLQNSYLLNIDPYNVYEVNASFYVHTDYRILPNMEYQNPDSTPALLNAYHALLSNSTLIKSISDATGIDIKYIPELIISEVTASSNPGVLILTVTHADPEKALTITNLIEAFLKSHTEDLQARLGNHTLTFISNASGPKTSQSIADQQKEATEYLATLHTELEKLQQQRDSLQISVSSPSVALVAAVGAVLGALLVIAVAFFSHLGSGKIYSDRVLINHTGIKVLGCIPASGKCNPIDYLLRKAEGRCMHSEAVNVAAAVIVNYCADVEHLLIAGSCNAETIDALRESLTKIGVRVSHCGDLLHNTEALHLLPECDAVVLVEKCAVSTYSDVERAMECIRDHNKQLLGCILVDG